MKPGSAVVVLYRKNRPRLQQSITLQDQAIRGGLRPGSMTLWLYSAMRLRPMSQMTGHNWVPVSQDSQLLLPHQLLLLLLPSCFCLYSARCRPRYRCPFSTASCAGVEPVTSLYVSTDTEPPCSRTVQASPLPLIAAQ